jgi:hypothetical protein
MVMISAVWPANNERPSFRDRATCRANQFNFCHVASRVTPQKSTNRLLQKTKFARRINLIGIVQSHREKFFYFVFSEIVIV